MARSDPQLNFRIPADLRDRLEAAAKENKRSLTAELIERIEASFASDEQAYELAFTATRLKDEVAKLTAQLDAARAERKSRGDVSKEVVDAQRRTIRALEMSLALMARHMVEIGNKLPKKFQDESGIRSAIEYATSLPGVSELLLPLSGYIHGDKTDAS